MAKMSESMVLDLLLSALVLGASVVWVFMIIEHAFPFDTYPTQSGTVRVPRVGGVCGLLCLAAIYPRGEPDALL